MKPSELERPHVPDAVTYLKRVEELIGDRGKERDSEGGERSMAATVAAFNAITGHKLTEVDGWHFMELLKMVRSYGGVYHEDDYMDKIGYAALAAEASKGAHDDV